MGGLFAAWQGGIAFQDMTVADIVAVITVGIATVGRHSKTLYSIYMVADLQYVDMDIILFHLLIDLEHQFLDTLECHSRSHGPWHAL
jgi:hypothetical protein